MSQTNELRLDLSQEQSHAQPAVASPTFLPARHIPFWEAFYRWFSRVFFKLNFHDLVLHKEVQIGTKPVLVLGNHISFHEGFWLYHLNHTWFKKRFHLMMMEGELKKRISLNKVGVFSVRKGSRSLVDSLNYTLDLLKQPENLVVIFPAGRIQSLYTDHVPFESGVGRILKKAGDIQVVFQAAFVDYSSERKPTVELFFKEYALEDRSLATAEAAYNSFYRAARLAHQQKIDAEHT